MTDPITELFTSIGVQISPTDRFRIDYRDGFLRASVFHPDGRTEAVTKMFGSDDLDLIDFDPQSLSVEKRNALVVHLKAKGWAQRDVADLLDLSQSMISKIMGQ